MRKNNEHFYVYQNIISTKKRKTKNYKIKTINVKTKEKQKQNRKRLNSIKVITKNTTNRVFS